MKFVTVFRRLGVTALILCIACGSTSERPSTSTVSTGDTHSGEATLVDQKNLNDRSENYSMRWYESKSPHATKGVALGEARDVPLAETRAVALVIHGLNLRPSKMESVIKALTNSGIDALNVSLRGHGNNYDSQAYNDPARARLAAFKSVSYQLWMDEVCGAYAAAKNRSDKKDVPLYLIGYSLGGLMGTDLLATEPGVQFDKMVLFAPAVKMHLRNYLIRALSPFPRLTIPSFALATYQSNDGTPMAGYNALFDSLNNVAGNIGPQINVPTLVFIDPEDEIVSYSRLKQMVQAENLDQWEFYIVQKENTEGPAKIHHLIIDAPSTGAEVWRKMMAAMVNHLYH